ncbi:acylphosphatase [Glycomyces halotolerans]
MTVHGTVQGVFFRQACLQEAEDRGVRGWVRNRPDGTVEAVFEGESENVGALVSWAHRGPPSASVERVEVREEPPQDLAEFVVR